MFLGSKYLLTFGVWKLRELRPSFPRIPEKLWHPVETAVASNGPMDGSNRFLNKNTLPETNVAPENGRLEYFLVSFWVPAYFQGRTVSFRECHKDKFETQQKNKQEQTSNSINIFTWNPNGPLVLNGKGLLLEG